MFFFIKNEKKNLHIFLFYFEKKTKLKFPPQKKRIIFLFCFWQFCCFCLKKKGIHEGIHSAVIQQRKADSGKKKIQKYILFLPLKKKEKEKKNTFLLFVCYCC